jgi:type I restriction enzyme M protein
LKKFNVILANPPYSIKAWDQKGFANDPYGRNLWGVPPQGFADYAFQQHIQKSLDAKNGRSISLWPHGILFRDSEAKMRQKMIEEDLVECVIGLGPNMFYNSPMEACLLITSNNKPANKKGKILFVNAVNEVKQEKTMGYLENGHIDNIYNAYKSFESIKDFSALVDLKDVLANNSNMSISLYVRQNKFEDETIIPFSEVYTNWLNESEQLKNSMNDLFQILN